MKLGIEARRLYGGKNTGITNFSLNVLQSLQGLRPDIQFFLYAPESADDSAMEAIGGYTLRQRWAPLGIEGYFWTKFFAGKLVTDDDLDVFLAPRTLYPLGIARKVPVVSVLHDLSYLIYPRVVPSGTLLNNRLWLRHDVRHAAKVVTVSVGTSKRMQQLLGRCADAVVPPAVGPQFRPVDKSTIADMRARYGINSAYLLFVGTLEPRKNLRALLDALKILNTQCPEPLTLVLAGQRGWRNKELIARLDAGEPNVRELGYVPDRDLPALYSGSAAFVIPSIYEGYGMPAAEARACGTRVVATDIPELHEAAGPNATFAEPTAAGIAKGIKCSLAQPKPSASRPGTWRESAMILAKVLDDAASSKRRSG